MGGSNSKRNKIPNNPFEAQIAKRNRRKELDKQRKKEEKKRLKDQKKKHGKKLESLEEPTAPQVQRPSEMRVTEKRYNDVALRRIQAQLNRDSNTFILNQLMLSVQFYGNFEKELDDSIERLHRIETEGSKKLAKHRKTIILADRIHDVVDRKVKFCARHGPLKNTMLSLDTQRMYVVHDNIEVISAEESSQIYHSVTDRPVYKVVMEDFYSQESALRHRGYAKLRSLEKIEIRPSAGNSGAVVGELSDSGYATREDSTSKGPSDEPEYDIAYRPPMPPPTSNNATTDTILQEKLKSAEFFQRKSQCYINGIPFSTGSISSASPPASEYDYAYITSFNANKPLSIAFGRIHSSEPFSTISLPDFCISNVAKNDKIESDSEGYTSDDDRDESESSDEEDSIYEAIRQQYLNSKGFMGYFINIFRDQLALDLDYTKDQLDRATWRGARATVYLPPWEIIPAIHCPWPSEAFEWLSRSREMRENPQTRQQFQWPTPTMIAKVQSFGCHVIPVGYTPKTGHNSQRDLEWKIVFPLAERYLECCLSPAQITVFMVVKTLIKTFVEPYIENGKNMITTDHIRTHLFWQCENNFAAWHETFLGEALVQFLTGLLNCIKTHRLPDYFLPRRNLFENIPERNLVELHKRIFRITENPVIYVMIALRNLKNHKVFYPKLRLKMLYTLLMIDDPLRVINPKLFETEENDYEEIKPNIAKEDLYVPIGAMKDVDKPRKEPERLRRRRQLKHKQQKMVRFNSESDLKRIAPQPPTEMKRSLSVESFDVKLVMHRQTDYVRRKAIFDLFIRHYTNMARWAVEIGALHPCQVYLEQCERFTTLLHDSDAVEEANALCDAWQPLRERLEQLKSRRRQERPALPQRDSIVMRSTRRQRIAREDEDPYVNLDSIKKMTQPQQPQAPPPNRAPPKRPEKKVPRQRREERSISSGSEAEDEKSKAAGFITADELLENTFRRAGASKQQEITVQVHKEVEPTSKEPPKRKPPPPLPARSTNRSLKDVASMNEIESHC